MAYYNSKKYINKKDIEFLEKLEIKLQKQAQEKTRNEKDKLLISNREFQEFYKILDKIEYNHSSNIEKQVLHTREKRKADKDYGREFYMKQYHKDKEEAKKQGIKFTKTIKDYKEMYKNN